jgi:hypothetical protein
VCHTRVLVLCKPITQWILGYLLRKAVNSCMSSGSDVVSKLYIGLLLVLPNPQSMFAIARARTSCHNGASWLNVATLWSAQCANYNCTQCTYNQAKTRFERHASSHYQRRNLSNRVAIEHWTTCRVASSCERNLGFEISVSLDLSERIAKWMWQDVVLLENRCRYHCMREHGRLSIESIR